MAVQGLDRALTKVYQMVDCGDRGGGQLPPSSRVTILEDGSMQLLAVGELQGPMEEGSSTMQTGSVTEGQEHLVDVVPETLMTDPEEL
ncbi:hypothetical protein NDU88_004163 [Pleurodeles waltl]|uniref:Uncharacterized protein n=1 Tax=Pleurodeles waltl TaxID=8319 RepID=A0AAV7NIK2_PLEWA|nr:hypothetical protein NDU88_004163 [Pleurodeles waltl]